MGEPTKFDVSNKQGFLIADLIADACDPENPVQGCPGYGVVAAKDAAAQEDQFVLLKTVQDTKKYGWSDSISLDNGQPRFLIVDGQIYPIDSFVAVQLLSDQAYQDEFAQSFITLPKGSGALGAYVAKRLDSIVDALPSVTIGSGDAQAARDSIGFGCSSEKPEQATRLPETAPTNSTNPGTVPGGAACAEPSLPANHSAVLTSGVMAMCNLYDEANGNNCGLVFSDANFGLTPPPNSWASSFYTRAASGGTDESKALGALKEAALLHHDVPIMLQDLNDALRKSSNADEQNAGTELRSKLLSLYATYKNCNDSLCTPVKAMPEDLIIQLGISMTSIGGACSVTSFDWQKYSDGLNDSTSKATKLAAALLAVGQNQTRYETLLSYAVREVQGMDVKALKEGLCKGDASAAACAVSQAFTALQVWKKSVEKAIKLGCQSCQLITDPYYRETLIYPTDARVVSDEGKIRENEFKRTLYDVTDAPTYYKELIRYAGKRCSGGGGGGGGGDGGGGDIPPPPPPEPPTGGKRKKGSGNSPKQ